MKNKSEKIHIAFITDNNYALPTGVAITSLEKNRDLCTNYEINILCVDVEEANINKFKKMEKSNFNIVIKRMAEYSGFENIKQQTEHVSPAALYKFLLPEIFVELDKILYLDGDIIINKDLKSLFMNELDNHYIAAVPDIIATKMYNPNMIQRLKLNTTYYFNSGVMLLNLKAMREENLSELLIDYRKNGINYFMDQDAFNSILGRKMVILDPSNNDLSTMHEQCTKKEIVEFFKIADNMVKDYQLDNAKIIHLTSAKKPWKFHVLFYTKLFVMYYEQSEFFQGPLELMEVPKKYLVKQSRLRKHVTKLIKNKLFQLKNTTVFGG